MNTPSLNHSLLHRLPLVILGTGFTGHHLYHQAVATGWKVFTTSRMPQTHLRDLPSEHHIHFDLNQPETWDTIPTRAHLIWSFPAVPLKLVKRFFASRPIQNGRIIVMGSTSAYSHEGIVVTECTALNPHLPRVQGEEYLRTAWGAIVIRLAGLYGPGRNVVDWIKKGKIQNTPKWVNLLHVADAAGICLHALERAKDGSTYLASDGTPRTWEEIFSVATSQGIVPPFSSNPAHEPGKRVSITKLLTELDYTLRFPDLFQALNQLETGRAF